MRHRWVTFIFTLGVAFGLVACGGGAAEAPARTSGDEVAQAPVAAKVAEPEPDLAAHMQASFWMAVRARDALIAGDLPAAQRAADALVQQDYTQLLPADWTHWVSQIKQHARELSMAPNVSSASQELGRIALTCGACHDLHQRGPARVRPEPEPWRDPPEQLDERMLRHQLGAEQIWDGLVLPSEHAFRSGTITLTRAPLNPPLQGEQPIEPSLQARIEEVRGLARAARSATSYDERGRVYGELIARCASCHVFLRRSSI